MPKLLILIFLCCPLAMISQHITGKIYDDESTVRGATILNKTQNIVTYSDDAGNFKLNVAVNDSLVIRSLFHIEQRLAIKKHDFNEVLVIELKKSLNTLDEVLLEKQPDFKPFDPVESNTTLKNQILEDIKRNPHLYGKSPSGNFDLVAIGKLIGKLFKSKKPTQPISKPATYAQLDQLFQTNEYFNKDFLKMELNIPLNYTYLFLEFCTAQSIDSTLLLAENRFLLVDILLKCSTDFLEIIDSQTKD